MKTVRMTMDTRVDASPPGGRIDPRRVDATTEAEIAAHQAADDADATLDAARFARRVRRRRNARRTSSGRLRTVSMATGGSSEASGTCILWICMQPYGVQRYSADCPRRQAS
jgi:hypothetical protein